MGACCSKPTKGQPIPQRVPAPAGAPSEGSSVPVSAIPEKDRHDTSSERTPEHWTEEAMTVEGESVKDSNATEAMGAAPPPINKVTPKTKSESKTEPIADNDEKAAHASRIDDLLAIPFDKVLRQFPRFASQFTSLPPPNQAAFREAWHNPQAVSSRRLVSRCVRNGAFDETAADVETVDGTDTTTAVQDLESAEWES
eukprot:Sspe_Gene.104013::Locus_79894_Transcript_1_1_Confidence_1.000_Length_689::g.104013::m.104013